MVFEIPGLGSLNQLSLFPFPTSTADVLCVVRVVFVCRFHFAEILFHFAEILVVPYSKRFNLIVRQFIQLCKQIH